MGARAGQPRRPAARARGAAGRACWARACGVMAKGAGPGTRRGAGAGGRGRGPRGPQAGLVVGVAAAVLLAGGLWGLSGGGRAGAGWGRGGGEARGREGGVVRLLEEPSPPGEGGVGKGEGESNTPSASPQLAEGAGSGRPPASEPRFYRVRVVQEFPHDRESYTQGLLHHSDCSGTAASPCRDILYESAGLYKKSTLREVLLQTGEVLQSTRMPNHIFAEGLAVNPLRPGELVQLAWQTSTGFSYDRETLNKIGEFNTTLGDGWGLTNSPEFLIATDSGSALHFLDPATFQPVRSVDVTEASGRSVHRLNELEWVEGEVWANIYGKGCIVRIDPDNGSVLGWVVGVEELLRKDYGVSGEVMNGIAYDSATQRLWLTGKRWDKLFQVEIDEVNESFTTAQLRRRDLNCLY